MGAPQLNIKDAETTAMVRQLAELTGETQTEVVRKAVKQRLEREKGMQRQNFDSEKAAREREIERVLTEIREIQAEAEALGLAENMLSEEDLYDENGLPR